MTILVTLIEAAGLGALLYLLLRTLKGVHGARRTATWKMVLAALGGPVPVVLLVWGLRAVAGYGVTLVGLVALWAVLAVAAAGLGFWGQPRAAAR